MRCIQEHVDEIVECGLFNVAEVPPEVFVRVEDRSDLIEGRLISRAARCGEYADCLKVWRLGSVALCASACGVGSGSCDAQWACR